MRTETPSVAKTWRRSALTGFLLLSLSVGCAWATDPVSPEEALLALYAAGKVDEGREGFRKLIDDRLAEVDRDLEGAKARSSLEPVWELAAISETMNLWESAEVRLQLLGGETPYSVYVAVERRLGQVDNDLEWLVAGKAWSEGDEASLKNAGQTLNKSFTKTIAFLWSSVSVGTRKYLLTRAAKWTDAPATLEEFDARNSDLVKIFKIDIDSFARYTAAQDNPAQALALLESVMPERPAEVTLGIVSLMEKAGSTKRLDAAVLLIRALAFNWSVSGSNEYLSLFGMLTAAPRLKRHYGSAALPLLLYAGVTTDQEWLQRRIVLVIREVGTEGELATVRAAFSLKESANPAVRRFGELLDTRDLQIQLADPYREQLEKDLVEWVRSIKDAKPPQE